MKKSKANSINSFSVDNENAFNAEIPKMQTPVHNKENINETLSF